MASFFDKEKLLKIANGVLSTTTPNSHLLKSQINTKHLQRKVKAKNKSINGQRSKQKIKSLMLSLQLTIFK